MKAMRTTKLIAGEWMVANRRMWPSAGMLAGCTVLALGLAGGFPVAAQESDSAAQTNDMTPAEVLARLGRMIQGDDSNLPEDMAAPEDQTGTNAAPTPGVPAQGDSRLSSSNRFANPNRAQNDDRRSRRRSRSRSNQSGGYGSGSSYNQGSYSSQSNAASGTNGSLARLDYSAFRIIVDRNIFDPNRFPHDGSNGPRPRPKIVDSLTLRGTITYERGTFAVFEGSSADYTKNLKLNDRIAGYKVTNIGFNGVKLVAGTNTVDLGVGMQLRREENGPWMLSSAPGSYTALSASTSTNVAAATGVGAASSDADSETIRRLKQRREE